MLPWFSGKAACPDHNLSEIQNLYFNVKTKRMYPSRALKNEKFKKISELADQ